MKITRIIERTIPIGSSLRNSRLDFSEMTVSAVAVVTDQVREGRPVVGYAFNSFGRYGCGGPLRERFIPRLLAARPDDINDQETGIISPARAIALLLSREKLGAHAERSMAVGTLEMALWDIVGKMHGKPLYQVLIDTFSTSADPASRTVPCYVGGGFYKPEDDLRLLGDEVRGYLDSGYTAVKIKAAGLPLAEDMRRIEAVLALVGGGGNLAVDAGCAFERQGALDYARAIAPYDLRWFEEPCDPIDFETYRAVSEVYSGKVAGGENLFSREEVDNFLRYGPRPGKLVLQPDPPLAYGIVEFHRIMQTAMAHGVAPADIMPHGGNMMSLHVAAGLGLGSAESYPGLFGPFGGFSTEVRISEGQASLPSSPGIGFEEQPALYKVFAGLRE